MPTVTEVAELPGGELAAHTDYWVTLVASVSGEAVGYATVSGNAIHGQKHVRVGSDGAFSMVLEANDLISPANTVWRIVSKAPGRPNVTRYIDVPDGAGPYVVKDIPTTAPTDLDPPALDKAMRILVGTADGYNARDAGLVATYIGPVEPTDQQTGDLWIDTSGAGAGTGA